MKFQEYIDRKNLQAESNQRDHLNEEGIRSEEATNVDFGLFSWGGGGEIDRMAAATAAAGLLLAKSLYNGVVYGVLKAQLPGYLKKYKIAAAPKSKEVYDAKYEKEKIEPLRKKKETLLGTGGEREDQDVVAASRGGDDEGGEGKTPKERIKEYYKNQIDNAPTEDKKAQFREKRDAALQSIDVKVQAIQNAIDKLEARRDVAWENIQEDWRQFEESFKKKSEGRFGFVEVRDSILASSWRKKWEKEFTIAKKEADIEVLDEALQIALDNKNEKEIDAIKNAKKRAEESKAAAEAAIDEVEEVADKAEAQKITFEKLGVTKFMQAEMMYRQLVVEKYQKWAEMDVESEESKGRSKKDALQYKIDQAQKKIEKGTAAAKEAKDAGNEERASKIEAAVGKIKQDLEAYQEELSKIGESLDDATYYSLYTRIVESIKMLDILLEEEDKDQPNTPSFTDVRKVMQKAISKEPDAEKQKSLASEAISDVQAIAEAKNKEVEIRNEMVNNFQELKKSTDKDKPELPKGSEIFSGYEKADPDKEAETFNNVIKDLESQGGKVVKKEKPKENTDDETEDQGTSTDDQGNDQKGVERAQQELDKHRKDVLEPFKEDLKQLKGEENPDEKKVKELELTVMKAELQELNLQYQLANAKKDDKEKEKLMKSITDKKDEIEVAEKGGKKEETNPVEDEEAKEKAEEIVNTLDSEIKDGKKEKANADEAKKKEEDKLKDEADEANKDVEKAKEALDKADDEEKEQYKKDYEEAKKKREEALIAWKEIGIKPTDMDDPDKSLWGYGSKQAIADLKKSMQIWPTDETKKRLEAAEKDYEEKKNKFEEKKRKWEELQKQGGVKLSDEDIKTIDKEATADADVKAEQRKKKKDESVNKDIPKRYMKFEEFLAMKNRK